MSITDASYRFVADLVRRESAMLYYGPGKEYLVESRLLPRARIFGDPDVDAYVARLRTDAAERRAAVDALTINETSWFRDASAYQALRDVVVPALVEARRPSRRISVWSAACSSGQEAYSIAMMLEETLPSGWTYEILATDVSATMVERVRAARYSQVEVNRGLPATQLVRHFTRSGSDWLLGPDLRRAVRAQELNLATPFPRLPVFDVVLLRNVLIYFDMDTKRDVLRKVHRQTAPDGYLLLGTSETTIDLTSTWARELAGRVPVHRPARLGAASSADRPAHRIHAAATGAPSCTP